MNYPVYGIYLVPAPPLAYQIGLLHQQLAQQFGVRRAGNFMPHCTIKGFFKMRDGATPQDMFPVLDQLFATTPAFPLEIKQLKHQDAPGMRYGANALLWLERTPAMQQLHNSVIEATWPFVAPDCPFTFDDHIGENFKPHITIAFVDMPQDDGLLAQTRAFIDYCYSQFQPAAHNSAASFMQFIKFETKGDWRGDWSSTLTFEQLKGWILKSAEF